MDKILLVEDDPFLVDIYTTKFKETGFAISSVTDGAEAISRIEAERPGIVLLDIVLPNLDGWDILKKIKENPALQKIKIIILSNLSQSSEVEKARALGADKYLIKAHYTPSEVVGEVKKLMEKT